MAGPEFFQTRMGQRFYEATMPRIASALERIATQLESQNLGQGQADPSDIPPPAEVGPDAG